MARDNYLYRGGAGAGGMTDADFGMDPLALADNNVVGTAAEDAAASVAAGSLKTGTGMVSAGVKAEAATTNKESMPIGAVTGIKREREE